MDNFAAPYPQAPIPASMGQYIPQVTSNANMPSQVAQTFSQNMASISANNLLGAQSKPSSQMNSPQSGASPAAPAPAPAQAPVQAKTQTQSPSQPQVQSQAQAQVQAQLAALEKDRVAWLLEINSTLLQKVVDLQAAGTAGPASTPDGNTPASEQADGSKVNQKSTLYIDCMRRLQANLAYLATIADRSKKVGGVAPQGPAIMTPPPNLPAVDELYAKLVDSVNKSTPQRPSPNGGPSPRVMHDSAI